MSGTKLLDALRTNQWHSHSIAASGKRRTFKWNAVEKTFGNMMGYVTLFVLLVLLGVNCWAQGNGSNTSKLSAVSTGQRFTINEKGPLPGSLQEVLFATNEDCRLFINEEAKGLLTKKNFLYLQLPSGTYRYIAKSQTTGDEWRDTFSVMEGKPTEVFIDMLYAIDKGRELRIDNKLASAAKTKTVPAVAQKKDAGGVTEQATMNGLVANMVPIKGGTFVMGNNKSPSADEAEHPVMVSNFFMSRYEVTQEQWVSIMGYNPSVRKDCPTCPVENVSWEEVMVFIRKINGASGRKFRLPTEAEWEYVAKLGGKAEIDRAGGAEAYIKKTAWAFANSENKVHPVGKKQPNVAGIYDLLGNVSEWCMDWYGAFFYKEDFTEKDPEGPPLGKDKVVRGGNFKDFNGDRFRPSFRNKINPKYKGSELGFRLVMEGEN